MDAQISVDAQVSGWWILRIFHASAGDCWARLSLWVYNNHIKIRGNLLISIYSIPFQIYEYTVTLVTSFHMHKALGSALCNWPLGEWHSGYWADKCLQYLSQYDIWSTFGVFKQQYNGHAMVECSWVGLTPFPGRPVLIMRCLRTRLKWEKWVCVLK